MRWSAEVTLHSPPAVVADRRQRVAELLLQQHQGRLAREIDPDRVARLVLAASEGLQIRWLHDPTFKMEDEFGYLLELLGVSAD